MRYILKSILLLFLIVLTVKVNAQQEPIYSQYMFNMLAINPAYAGCHEVLSGTALFRKQWVGIPGAPQTTTLGIDIPDNINRLGFGIQLVNDVIGIQKTNSVIGSVAHRSHIFNGRDVLSVGLQIGLGNYYANYNQVDLIQPSDPAFSGIVVDQWLSNIGAGFSYFTKKFYFGLSAPTLINNRVISNRQTVEHSAVSGLSVPHYFITSGYVFDLNESLKLKPSILIKVVSGAPVNTDFNASLYFNDKMSIGASYRAGSAFVAIIDFQVTPQIKFGYAYDKSINNLKLYTTGSHEVMIRYELSIDKKIANPRLRYF